MFNRVINPASSHSNRVRGKTLPGQRLRTKPISLRLTKDQQEKLTRLTEWEKRSARSNLVLGVPLPK